MFPGGNNKLLIECQNYPIMKKMKAEGKWQEGMKLPEPEMNKMTGAVGQKIWQSGLPVLDDLHTISGDWKPEKPNPTPEEWGKYKAQKFIETLNNMQPGLAMFIVHSSDVTDAFKHIRGPIQPALAKCKNGNLVAYLRDSGDEPTRVQISESSDKGESWTASLKTDIPNTASVELLTLQDGKWAFLGNDIDDGRYRMSLYLSDDEGKTWRWKTHLEDHARDKGGYSYPCLIQTTDGLLHITYSAHPDKNNKSIKYVVVDPKKMTNL